MSLKHNISPCHQYRVYGETAMCLVMALWETWSGAGVSWNDVSVPG